MRLAATPPELSIGCNLSEGNRGGPEGPWGGRKGRAGPDHGGRGAVFRTRDGDMAMTDNGRLSWLVAAHIALGVVAGVLAPVPLRTSYGLDKILSVPLFASALSQALLLALWA